MNILENKDYHAEDLWYSKEILAKNSQYRNIKIFIFNNNPVFIYKLKYFPLKMKAYVPHLEESSIFKIMNLARISNVPISEFITNHRSTLIESFPYKINKSYRATYIIDLNRDIETLFSSLKDFRRRNIKKANKKGVTITQDVNKGIIDEWWNLYLRTSKNRNFVPQKKELIYDLLIAGHCHLFTAWKDNKLLAGIVIVANNYPYFWVGASSREYPDYDASSLLHWNVIELYKDKGYHLYDMGGASLDEEHGPTRFKKAFGGELVKTISYEVVFKPYVKKFLDYLISIYYGKLKKAAF